MKMNWKKINFPWKKWNFELIENSAHTTEFFTLGVTLLARPYLYLNVYIMLKKI